MKITVVGVGKVGALLARQLQKEGHDVAVVDTNESVIENLSNTMDVIGYVGNGATYPVLQSVGVANCDLLIAVTESDEINMLCCLAGHKLGAKHTVARVRNPEYAGQLSAMKDDLGLSMAINPERATADEIARVLRFPSAARVELFARGRVELVSCRVPSGCILDGMRLNELQSRLNVRMLICAVDRNGEVSIPGGDFTLKEGDDIYFTGAPKEIENGFRAAKLLANPVKSVMIAGGGRITYYLASRLSGNRSMSIKIIEQDQARAEELASMLPQAVILNGDASDHELLTEEGLKSMDAFVALTGLDEGNILSGLYARKKQVSKVIAKVNNEHLVSVAKAAGLETTVSAKVVTVNIILRYVRALAASGFEDNVKALYKIVGGRVEVLEFSAEDYSIPLLGIPLSKLKLKKNILIACIVRAGQAIIPGGSDTIESGDSVLVVTADQRIGDLSDILEVQR